MHNSLQRKSELDKDDTTNSDKIDKEIKQLGVAWLLASSAPSLLAPCYVWGVRVYKIVLAEVINRMRGGLCVGEEVVQELMVTGGCQ